MELDDVGGAGVAVGAALGALVFSPRVRGWLRKGAVYGIAGVLIAGDAITSFGRGVGEGARQATSSTMNATSDVASPPETNEPEKAGA